MRTKWSKEQLIQAVEESKSIRQVIIKLGLRPAGGNYVQVKKYIKQYALDASHFHGQAWNKGLKGVGVYRIPLNKILVKNSQYQSYKLKKRLIKDGIFAEHCSECHWAKRSADGRIPLELDHINGDRYDNRLKNLRILCPNCHSLKPTHRGRNKLK